LWKSTSQLRKLNAEYNEVVERRQFLEAQEARLTGKPLPDGHPDKKKETKSKAPRIPASQV
jgi:hypothetical protein